VLYVNGLGWWLLVKSSDARPVSHARSTKLADSNCAERDRAHRNLDTNNLGIRSRWSCRPCNLNLKRSAASMLSYILSLVIGLVAGFAIREAISRRRRRRFRNHQIRDRFAQNEINLRARTEKVVESAGRLQPQ
jgi:hypothetical protein